MKIGKEYRPLVKKALASGWSLDSTGSGHPRLRSPENSVVTIPASPSDKRGWLNARSQLRRAGLDV